ncbi:hypothetical protein LEP1GSC151_0179 [Leptospira interrogans serovar Grippotyphosa str. LT2186]|uniref:Uncharacterized protein n=2 Tax=Leptospira interrogans TaxID=173 RepID=M3FZ66_LEPIR|nr:hypothetical protein LEP1GSC104_2959 [Leptospira interrogans str. UI 12621]EKR28306.1 hypothetical protein LEP1GSC087_3406 [Leptospira interrogans serovar Bataviae str. L1111]EKR46358.1 hypothetical protein LEP1GSC097_3631 [Leptospira interrogans serovar Grippotyphosa str. UI 08368]EMG12879.1 hypothetical protein LEP1GSC151_0179 [Leptospira interrogans serovar Grippotyphosa str. LT2186]EMN54994.1 hypothetical protein LEP1GSC089_0421 [Leptospira interrogans serovar Autumnalis str. LP101]EMN8
MNRFILSLLEKPKTIFHFYNNLKTVVLYKNLIGPILFRFYKSFS